MPLLSRSGLRKSRRRLFLNDRLCEGAVSFLRGRPYVEKKSKVHSNGFSTILFVSFRISNATPSTSSDAVVPRIETSLFLKPLPASGSFLYGCPLGARTLSGSSGRYSDSAF